MKRGRKISAVFAWVALTLCFVLSVVSPVLADMGEKPSVQLRILNAPTEDYCVGLFEPGEPHKEEAFKTINEKATENKFGFLRAKMCKFEANGYRLAERRGGNFFIENSDGYWYKQDTFYFSYYAPSTFKVCVVTESFFTISSEEITTSRYAGKVVFDVNTGELYEDTEAYAEDDKNVLLRSLGFLLATLLIEGILLVAFNLISKRNVIIFFIANIATQAFLHWSANSYRVHSGKGPGYAIMLLFWELLILIVETLLYGSAMEEKDGKRWKCFVYGIVANLVSAFCSLLVP